MAATESQMLELGTQAPEFSLPDPDFQCWIQTISVSS